MQSERLVFVERGRRVEGRRLKRRAKTWLGGRGDAKRSSPGESGIGGGRKESSVFRPGRSLVVLRARSFFVAAASENVVSKLKRRMAATNLVCSAECDGRSTRRSAG